MSEQNLDALIETVLRTDTIVTGRQKRLAWERLEQRAAHQTIWPPLVEPESSLTGTLRYALTQVRRGFAILLIDEGNYERARQERLTFYLIPVASTQQMLFEFSAHMRPQI